MTELLPGARKRKTIRRLYSMDAGIRVGVFMHGPKWRRYFGVIEVAIADVVPAEQIKWHTRGKKILMFTLEDDIRERILEEIRPGVYAAWSDPLERLGLNGL